LWQPLLWFCHAELGGLCRTVWKCVSASITLPVCFCGNLVLFQGRSRSTLLRGQSPWSNLSPIVFLSCRTRRFMSHCLEVRLGIHNLTRVFLREPGAFSGSFAQHSPEGSISLDLCNLIFFLVEQPLPLPKCSAVIDYTVVYTYRTAPSIIWTSPPDGRKRYQLIQIPRVHLGEAGGGISSCIVIFLS